jgi:hypothetical protein
MHSLCVPAIGPSSIPSLVGVIASASLRRTRMVSRYSCLTSRTCPRAVPRGLPSGRRARKVHCLTAGSLTSSKAHFLSLLCPLRVTHTRVLYVFSPPSGVNLLEINQATLHTTLGCQMPPDPQRQPQSGQVPILCVRLYSESIF